MTSAPLPVFFAEPFAKLAAQMGLPQTATLALPGPMPILGLPVGRAWFDAFDAAGDLLPVRIASARWGTKRMLRSCSVQQSPPGLWHSDRAPCRGIAACIM